MTYFICQILNLQKLRNKKQEIKDFETTGFITYIRVILEGIANIFKFLFIKVILAFFVK